MIARVTLLSVAGFALAGCNAAAPPPPPAAPVQNSSITPPGFKLPEGSGCSGEVARYRAVIANDISTGNVGASVGARIEGEIAQAAAACQAGKDGEAIALVRASKARHGYPG